MPNLHNLGHTSNRRVCFDGYSLGLRDLRGEKAGLIIVGRLRRETLEDDLKIAQGALM